MAAARGHSVEQGHARARLSRYDDLKVFARYDHGAIAGPIELSGQIEEIGLEHRSCRRVERIERFQYWAVGGPEDLQPTPNRTVPKHEMLA